MLNEAELRVQRTTKKMGYAPEDVVDDLLKAIEAERRRADDAAATLKTLQPERDALKAGVAAAIEFFDRSMERSDVMERGDALARELRLLIGFDV